MAHTVTVTRPINAPLADSDDPEYVIGGTHDYQCECFKECTKDWHRHPSPEYGEGHEEWTTKRVTQPHQWFNGGWMVRQENTCGFRLAFEQENPEWQMTEVGVYDVEVSWDGDWWFAALTLRTPTPDQEQK